MKIADRLVTLSIIVAMSSSAFARDRVAVQPVQIGQETVRYLKGRPTLDLERNYGVIELSPDSVDHGSLVMTIAIYNDGNAPVNFGIENLRAELNGSALPVLTAEQLMKRAENRALWSQIGMAFLGAAAAAAAANNRYTYSSTTYSRFGSFHTYGRFSDPNSLQNSMLIGAATGYGIREIQDQLDRTRDAIGDNVIQLTTVDPGESYAGKIVLEKFNMTKLPAHVRVIATMNGEDYPLEFQIAKPGTPAPSFTAITPAQHQRQLHAAQPTGSSAAPGGPALMVRTAAAPVEGRIPIRGGYKVPAKTVSGYCLDVEDGYRGTGSDSTPAVSDAMPRCTPGT